MEFDAQAQQYDRDLRGPSRDHKRHKDSTTKWSKGEMALPGLRWDWANDSPLPGHEAQEMKVRPLRVHPLPSYYKPHHNIVKLGRSGRGNQFLPSTRVRSAMGIAEEIIAATDNREVVEEGKDLLPTTSPVGGGVSNDPFLYSFDSRVTPGAPLSLDVFVKQPTARDTERLVEKEYEVVDENGLALKGKERKGNLRKTGSGLEDARVDDGFELV